MVLPQKRKKIANGWEGEYNNFHIMQKRKDIWSWFDNLHKQPTAKEDNWNWFLKKKSLNQVVWKDNKNSQE